MPLPFELAALPHQFFGALRLPVVSYALPALIAIGQAIHHHRPTRNPLTALAPGAGEGTDVARARIDSANERRLSRSDAAHFVCHDGTRVLRTRESSRGAEGRRVSLRASVRADGSWPIDTNLATWVTTLAIKALAHQPARAFAGAAARHCASGCSGSNTASSIPTRTPRPGGWAWTDLPGGVPDADDTPGALLALLALGAVDAETRSAGIAGVRWLLDLQNRDGGIPTFCRGWGALPFDRSCARSHGAHAARVERVVAAARRTTEGAHAPRDRTRSALSRTCTARRWFVAAAVVWQRARARRRESDLRHGEGS